MNANGNIQVKIVNIFNVLALIIPILHHVLPEEFVIPQMHALVMLVLLEINAN
jgi:hypothetical protein